MAADFNDPGVLDPTEAAMLVDQYDDFTILGRVSGLFRRFTRAQTEAVGA